MAREDRRPIEGRLGRDASPYRSRMRVFLIVLAEEVFAEITVEIAPHSVDVIVVVLRIIEFHQEGRALDAVVMSFTALEASSPSELDFVQARLFDFRKISFRQLGPI